jgi:hypothetical protein
MPILQQCNPASREWGHTGESAFGISRAKLATWAVGDRCCVFLKIFGNVPFARLYGHVSHLGFLYRATNNNKPPRARAFAPGLYSWSGKEKFSCAARAAFLAKS